MFSREESKENSNVDILHIVISLIFSIISLPHHIHMPSIQPQNKHITGGQDQGGKTCLYKRFEGAKALLRYVNHQVNGSAGGSKSMQNFLFGGNPPCPLQIHACHKVLSSQMSQ